MIVLNQKNPNKHTLLPRGMQAHKGTCMMFMVVSFMIWGIRGNLHGLLDNVEVTCGGVMLGNTMQPLETGVLRVKLVDCFLKC